MSMMCFFLGVLSISVSARDCKKVQTIEILSRQNVSVSMSQDGRTAICGDQFPAQQWFDR